jgi:hypothetical protein
MRRRLGHSAQPGSPLLCLSPAGVGCADHVHATSRAVFLRLHQSVRWAECALERPSKTLLPVNHSPASLPLLTCSTETLSMIILFNTWC